MRAREQLFTSNPALGPDTGPAARARGWWPLGLLAVLLAGALLYLFLQDRRSAASDYYENVALLRQIKELDATWEADVLKARLGMKQDGEALAATLHELDRLPKLLRIPPAGQSGSGALDASVAALRSALTHKAGLIAQFQVHNDALRNALAFLPQATDELVELGADGGSGAVRHAGAAANKVLLATLVYNGRPSDEAFFDIELALAVLSAAARPLPPALAQRLEQIGLHARTVVRERLAVRDLLLRVTAAPAAAHADRISAILTAEHQHSIARVQQQRLYLLLLSAALAALLLYAALRLIRSHAIIQRVNSELQQVNEGLEAAVRERTGELLSANGQLQTEIAERKQLEGRLVQSEKLASIGQLAAGVAHEINNPLAFLGANAAMLEQYLARLFEMLAIYRDAEQAMAAQPELAARLRRERERLELDYLHEDIPDILRESRQGMARVSKIVQALKEFARSDAQQQWEPADLHRCIDATLELIASDLQQKAGVVKQYGALPDIECVPSQLSQVVMHLLLNACQAVGPQRGRITIRTGTQDGQAWFEVADDGCGMAPEVVPRIFDPFFTTRDIGQGTGLGLALSYGIVQQHRGRIDVQSAPGAGSTFRVTLPLRRAEES
ncbi:DAHL domain-containing protein [Massilia sp. Root351]|uniref:DAHL domain-containing protein n=1 Tax=Massilia sp. Root351 TaxID=1736522 RepID=UPI0009EC65AE|nr:DAHL domain-containing protein [Massilia sp. Root351]